MNLNHLTYFKVLSQTLHYHKAAFQLSITQPALSYAIDTLEKELGFKLFIKKGRNVELTATGTIFLKYVNIALDALDEGVKKGRISLGNKETLIISACSSCFETFLLSLVDCFKRKERYAEISVRLQLASTHTTLAALKKGDVDFGFCAHIKQEEESILFYPIREHRFVLITSIENELSMYSSATLQDIARYPLICFSKWCATRQFVDDKFNEEKIIPLVACEAEGTNSICGLVERNIGVAIVPFSPLLKNFKIKVIPLKHHEMVMQMCLAMSKKRTNSPQGEMFRDFVKEMYS